LVCLQLTNSNAKLDPQHHKLKKGCFGNVHGTLRTKLSRPNSGCMMILPLDRGETESGFPGDEEYLKVEQWLDNHPDFVQDYFSRKATRSLIDGWLYNHSGGGEGSGGTGSLLGYDVSSTGSNSKGSSGASTPVRKISAQEFEKRGHILKPMVFKVDGMPSFLGEAAASVPDTNASKPRRRRSQLKVLDECDLIYELVMDICNDLDMTSLCHKILQNVSLLLGADRCSLFLVEGEKASADFCLCSKLFDVNIRSTVHDSMRVSQEIRVPWGTGIVGHVAMTGEALNIPEAYEVSDLVTLLVICYVVFKFSKLSFVIYFCFFAVFALRCFCQSHCCKVKICCWYVAIVL